MKTKVKKTNVPFLLTKDTNLLDVVLESPRATELLGEYGLHCIGCAMNQFDTLEIGAKIHGMTDKEIKTMIKEINEELLKEKKK